MIPRKGLTSLFYSLFLLTFRCTYVWRGETVHLCKGPNVNMLAADEMRTCGMNEMFADLI